MHANVWAHVLVKVVKIITLRLVMSCAVSRIRRVKCMSLQAWSRLFLALQNISSDVQHIVSCKLTRRAHVHDMLSTPIVFLYEVPDLVQIP